MGGETDGMIALAAVSTMYVAPDSAPDCRN